MRIAIRQPPATIVSSRALLMCALIGLSLAGVAAVAWRYHASGEAARTTPERLTIADAFGLGGLPRLTKPGLAPASAVQNNRIVAYYGTPRAPAMGILGQYSPEEVADLLAARATSFREIDPSTNVLPALHLVYGVAQPDAAGTSISVQYLDDRTVRQFIDLARRRGFALILDVQIGHSNALAEVRKMEQYLKEPDVFVALDPEFALDGSRSPGEAIGSLDASDINAVQWYLAALTAEQHLPAKMLIVHQFQQEMITDAASIERRPGVDLVIDMDGYGPADIKEVKYGRYSGAAYAPYPGIKVFLEHDPDPLTEQQLLELTPKPSLVIYQ